MAINFADTRVTATSNDKDVHVKVVKLTYADFTTGGTASVKAILPADATILEMSYWKKTAFSGNSISAATLSVGTPASATSFVNAFDIHGVTTGNQGYLNPISGIFQGYDVPLGGDIQLQFTGTATTGNPTAGEVYIKIIFVR